MVNLLTKIFGSKNERELKRLKPLVHEINKLEPVYEQKSAEEIRALTAEFKERVERGQPLEELIPETFAVVREASKRTLGLRHFDVQLLGGMILHEGKIAEMKTGEGKTLVATLPIYLNSLQQRGVHLVTVNDYLARRDADWMGYVYHYLGLEVGVIVSQMDNSLRRQAYCADVTYGQNNEFGFDYLRDNMKIELSEMVQRGHHYAIVDEVDSILIDEARTPLIISGPSDEATEKYVTANSLVGKLRENQDFTVDLKSKQVFLTDDGVKAVEQHLNIENLYDPLNIEIVHHVNQALKAHVAMKRDVDYVVRNNEVLIVDEFTGRLMSGRRWSDGLHQAVEAKEGVQIQQENQTLATITFQNYFRMYKKLAGMTGTADTEAVEFKKIYNLDVNVAPTHQKMIRLDYADVVFSTERGKFKAVCDEIEELHERGQPILVGTASIEKSEVLSALLKKRGIPHHVLNAKQHEREAEIVAQAGRFKAVTISTNMAGRGTDIVLGGNPAFLAATEAGTTDPSSPEYKEAFTHHKATCAEEREEVLAAGGLHILGTERHESRRIDNQLRGRSGRQGDPGTSRFYVSLEDDLMKRFGGEKMQAIMSRIGLQEEDAVEGRLVARAIENAQKKVEGYHFDIRKHLLEYDDVLNKQREVIYKLRSKIMHAENIESEVLEVIPDIVEEIIIQRANEKEPVHDWDVRGMFSEFNRIFGLNLNDAAFVQAQQGHGRQSLAQEIFDHICEQALKRYEERKMRFGVEQMSKLARIVFLQAIDYFWKDHLSNMDHLKEGIGLRGYGQKNPLHEYQREAFELFASVMAAVKVTVVQNAFNYELLTEEQIRQIEEREREMQRRREAMAHGVHESVLEGRPAGERGAGADSDTEGLNRHERRRQEALAKSLRYTPKPSDYAPSKSATAQKNSHKKKKKRK